MARTTKATPPTRAQMALLCEMTLGGKTLYASDRSRKSGGVCIRYHVCRADWSGYGGVAVSLVKGLESRGLIAPNAHMPHEMSWSYIVTEAGRAAVTAAQAETWDGNDC